MKLLIILSVIACSHAAKLDRTYLPPANAATAGGSPGFLNTPVGSAGPSGPSVLREPSGPQFNLPNNGAFGKTAGALNQPGAGPSSQYGQPVGPNFDAGFAQPSQNFGNQGQDYQRNQPERASASADRNAEILRSDSQNDGESYSYNFETSNGIAVEESGVATNGVQAQGAFSYSDDDGQMFRIAYTADENGFQPQGDHLPTPHPIPDEILKSIEQNAQAAAAGTQEGAYNPEEDNASSGPQQYNYNAPTSYSQGPAGQNGAFNQPQGKSPSQLYGSPNAASPSRPQGSQGPSQQYSAPSGSSFAGPQSPSQQYGAPSGGSSARPQGPSQQYGGPGAPSGSQGAQGPSQQYSAPGAPTGPQPSQQYGTPAGTSLGFQAAPNAGSTRPSFNQAQTKSPSALYGASSNGAARPNSFNGNQYQGPSNGGANGFAPSGPASKPSGFAPHGSASGSSSFAPSGPASRPSNSAQGIAQQYQAQPQSQGSAQAQDESGYQYNRPQGSSFGSNNGPSSQQYRPQNGAGSTGPQGSFSQPNSAGQQGSFGPAKPNSYGAASSPNAARPQGTFGSTPQGSFGSPARPNSQFIAPSGPSFGSPSQGFGQSGQSQPSSESGYQYNQPGGQGFGQGGQGSQSNFQATLGQGQNFKGPQQPPSFSEDEGYKY